MTFFALRRHFQEVFTQVKDKTFGATPGQVREYGVSIETIPPFSTLSSVPQLLTDAFAFSNKYVCRPPSPFFFPEDAGMLCFLVFARLDTDKSDASEGGADASRFPAAALNVSYCGASRPQHWELLTFNHEE